MFHGANLATRQSPKTNARGMRSLLAKLPAPEGFVRSMRQAVKIACIGAVGLLIVLGGVKYFAHSRQSAAEAAGIGRSVKIKISKKDDVANVALKLRQAGLIHSELYFKSLLKLKHAVVKPGTYTLTKVLSTSAIIAIIAT